MKRIDIAEMREFTECGSAVLYVAKGINEIMDYLERNLPTKTGKFYKCNNCGHTIYTPYEPTCACHNPDFEVINGT